MLNIYISEDVKTKTDRTISKIRKYSQICDDCWIDLVAPTDEEIQMLVERLDVPEEFLRTPLDDEERPRIDTDEDSDSLLMIVDIPYVQGNRRSYAWYLQRLPGSHETRTSPVRRYPAARA